MNSRQTLREQILSKAVVHGKVILSSGKEADYYVDLRRVTLDAVAAPLVGEVMLDLVKDWDFDAVGGLTLGADPVATAMMHVAAQRGKKIDSFVVRKAEKAHGLQRRIEGPDVKGRRVLAVEDTSTTGGSVLTAVNTEPPVVEVSSTARTRRPFTSGPSIRRCNPCAFSALRTTKESIFLPRCAATCIIAVATGSAPRVKPPTASKSQSLTRSSITSPTSGAATASRVTRRKST